MARPTVSLLELVEERRFSWQNKRHRRKLLEDSLLEFVAGNEAPPLWVQLADLQQSYRRAHRCLDRSYTSGMAQSFEKGLRLLDDEGEPLERGLVVL